MPTYRPGPNRTPWIPDAQTKECPLCSKKFTFLHRRHHCRMCGKVVCDDCSKTRLSNVRGYEHNKPQRVCIPCSQISSQSGQPALIHSPIATPPEIASITLPGQIPSSVSDIRPYQIHVTKKSKNATPPEIASITLPGQIPSSVSDIRPYQIHVRPYQIHVTKKSKNATPLYRNSHGVCEHLSNAFIAASRIANGRAEFIKLLESLNKSVQQNKQDVINKIEAFTKKQLVQIPPNITPLHSAELYFSYFPEMMARIVYKILENMIRCDKKEMVYYIDVTTICHKMALIIYKNPEKNHGKALKPNRFKILFYEPNTGIGSEMQGSCGFKKLEIPVADLSPYKRIILKKIGELFAFSYYFQQQQFVEFAIVGLHIKSSEILNENEFSNLSKFSLEPGFEKRERDLFLLGMKMGSTLLLNCIMQHEHVRKRQNLGTLLSWAAYHGHTHCVQNLLTLEKIKNNIEFIKKALSYAHEQEHKEIAQILLLRLATLLPLPLE